MNYKKKNNVISPQTLKININEEMNSSLMNIHKINRHFGENNKSQLQASYQEKLYVSPNLGMNSLKVNGRFNADVSIQSQPFSQLQNLNQIKEEQLQ